MTMQLGLVGYFINLLSIKQIHGTLNISFVSKLYLRSQKHEKTNRRSDEMVLCDGFLSIY